MQADLGSVAWRDIHASSSECSLKVSPSGSFLCCRNLVLKAWLPEQQQQQQQHHLGTGYNASGPNADTLNQTLGRGPSPAGFHKPSVDPDANPQQMRTTAVGHPSGASTLPLCAFPSPLSNRGKYWLTEPLSLPGDRLRFGNPHRKAKSVPLDHTPCHMYYRDSIFQQLGPEPGGWHGISDIYLSSHVSSFDTSLSVSQWGSLKSIFSSLFYHLQHIFPRPYKRWFIE